MILPTRIPAAPFAAVVSEFVARMDMGEVIQPAGMWGGAECRSYTYDNRYSAVDAVAGWAGVKWGTLYSVLSGRTKSVDFDFADRVICATVGPFAWHTDERLSRFYV